MADAARMNRLSNVLFYAVLALLVWLSFLIARPFLVPLGWAAILAILLFPWHGRLAARWGETRAATASTIGVTLGLIVPSILLGFYFVREAVEATQGLQDVFASGRVGWLSRAWMWIAQRTGQNDADLASLLQDAARAATAYLAGSLGGFLRNVVVVVLNVFVTLFALFYLLRDREVILRLVRRLLPFDESLREEMLHDVHELIHASVTVSLLIALVQGSINGAAFAIVGIGEPLFWGLIMTFLSLLPVVGAWPVWIPAAVWLFATGQTGRGILLLIICGGIAGTVDNVLRPMLLSGRTRLGSLPVFISVLGGIAAFGMIGFVLGPIIFALLRSLLDVYIRRPRTA